MVRITSGIAKGKKLKTPNLPDYRAVQDKAKLAIFSILGEKVNNARCLDLYAGSGNLGIEALSRGASWCDFVDDKRTCKLTIMQNLKETGFESRAEVFKSDVIKYVGNTHEKYDVIFADPFYKDVHFRFLFENLEEILNEKGAIVFSHGQDTDIEDALTNTKNLKVYDTRRYGNANITIITKPKGPGLKD